MLAVVKLVALGHARVIIGRELRHRMAKRLHQPHADHIRRILIAGLHPTHIQGCRLNAARDDGGGICQCAIPIESNQVKLAGFGGHKY